MKRGFIQASVVVLFGVIVTPLLMLLAYRERGYWAIGGEFAPLVLCLMIAFIILDHHRKQRDYTFIKEGEPCEMSKQSEQVSEKQ